MNSKTNKLALPHRYRNKVAQILSDKGIQVSPHDISNIIRGRVTDPEKTEPVLQAVKQVSRAHVRMQKKREQIMGL